MKTLLKQSTHSFLQGGGEMGELTRNYNWSLTPIGDPAYWPQSLRNTVSMILSSKFPMFLWWGDDMIQFYNDAYRPSLGNSGKHPLALGQKAIDCWPEIWDIIYPLIRQVQTTGESTWNEDLLVPIYRNGKIEDVYWTFSYSAIRGDSDKIEGVLVVCQETTNKVLAAKQLEKSVNNLHSIITNAPVAMCILRGENYIIDTINERVLELWSREREEVIHKPLFYALPEVAGQGLEELLDRVYTTGEPFTAYGQPVDLLKKGKMETVYLNFVYEAYRESDGCISGIIVLANDVTEQVNARHRIEDIVAQRTSELAEANEALTRMNRELARSNANLEEFAYAASHDMKEPIRKIHFFSDRLRSSLYSKFTEVEKLLFDRMDVAAKRMSSLIDDLLTYSQVSLKPQVFDKVDLGALVKQVIADFDLEIEQKKAIVSIDSLPVIMAHQNQVRQVFVNLISNALKYVRQDVRPEIAIRYSIAQASEIPFRPNNEKLSGQFHKIVVTDNGIGFESNDAERIFNVFTRLHGNAEYKGTGVGLSIAKKVIENHKGFIIAAGEPGNGSSFTLYLPLA